MKNVVPVCQKAVMMFLPVQSLLACEVACTMTASHIVQVGIELSCLCKCIGNKERCAQAEIVSESFRFGSVWATKM